MRIISGELKGRRFQPAKNFKGRPTTDFGRESLFNILSNQLDWETVAVLDLFSGTGAMAFEAMSRGALRASAVEIDRRACRQIEKNASELQLEDVHVFGMDVFLFIEKIGERFELIIADPPFDMECGQSIVQAIRDFDLLAPDGLLVVEHGQREDLSQEAGFQKMKKYGNVRFSFFRF